MNVESLSERGARARRDETQIVALFGASGASIVGSVAAAGGSSVRTSRRRRR